MPEQAHPEIATALALIHQVLDADQETAWAWHGALAQSFVDVGGDPWLAHQAAARWLQRAFAVETSTCPAYQDLKARSGG